MKLIRKLFFCLLTCALVWLGIYTYNRLTDGFNIHQITSSLPSRPEYTVALDPEKKVYLQALLDQEFHYLGKGCQFYVFESADGRCVIKFLKHKHLRPFTWLKALPLPKKLRGLCEAKIERRALRVNRLFSSCQLGYEKMQEETGLLFIHLNRVPALDKNIVLIDKMGLKHTIAVDEYEYCIQRKMTPLKEVFETSEMHDIQQKVQQLSALVLLRCQKGIGDRDRSFVQNVGFLEETQAAFMDFGQFYEDPSILQEEVQIQEIEKRLGNLRAWVKNKYPSMILP